VLNKSQVDSFILLSMVSNLKVDLNPKWNLKVDLNPSNKLFEPLAKWLNKPVRTWKLLYKWTKDEKNLKAWHKQCDAKGPTVTIIWANKGYVFGGYAHLPWASSGGWKESKESFLFSLTDGKNRQPYQCLPFQNFHQTIYDDSSCMCWSSDLYLRIPPQYTDNDSYSGLGDAYKVPDGFDGQTFLAGSYTNWTIEEIETYLV